jgi:uncharacterized membrane protein
MKRTFLVILLVLASFEVASAQEILEYNVNIKVENLLLREEIRISVKNNHPTDLRRLRYPFSGQVENLRTFDDSGGLESDVETIGGNNYVTTILREPLDFEENASVLYEFVDPSAVTFFNKTFFLSTSYPLLANVQKFELTLRLPEGTGLSDPNVDVVPAPSELTSDGRAIILKWRATNPSDFRVFVRYEPLPPPEETPTTTLTTIPPPPPTSNILSDQNLILALSILIFIIFTGLLVLKVRSRPRIQEKIDILKEDEQLILKIVAEDDGIDQREIQRRTDFSKTKVSKILTELEKREAIRKESMGKKNKIYLTQKLKE